MGIAIVVLCLLDMDTPARKEAVRVIREQMEQDLKDAYQNPGYPTN